MAGPNRGLPPLPLWAARSTYAAVLAGVIAILNIVNLDLYTLIGRGEEEVIDAIEGLVLLGSIAWFWIERRAPNRRLVAHTVQEDTHDVYETEAVYRRGNSGGTGPSGVWFLSSSGGGEGSEGGSSGGSSSAGDGGS